MLRFWRGAPVLHRRGFRLSWHSLLRVLVMAIAWVLAAPTTLRTLRLRLLVLLRLLGLRLMLRLPLGWLLVLLGRLGLLGLLMLLSLWLLALMLRLPLLVSVLVASLVLVLVLIGQRLAGSQPEKQAETSQPARNRPIPSNIMRVHGRLACPKRQARHNAN